MILHADTLDEGATLSADICIVGAGAAGIALALQFEMGTHSVLLLEAGPDGGDAGGLAASQAIYAGEVADAVHPPTDTYRQRRFGGSTTIWGGRCMPFDPIDFERRDWVPDSGWPFGLDTLLPYYRRANELCEAGDYAYTAEAAFPRGMRPMIRQFHGTAFTDNTLERFSCPTDFGQRYRGRLAASRQIRLLLGANVVDIRTDADGATVQSVAVKTLQGRSVSVTARQFVLATGGLEVPRLLLAARSQQSAGIGNQHDLVGRYYMSHIAGTVGQVRLAGGRDAVWHGYDIADDGTYCRRRFAVTAAAQRRLRIGNMVARLHHPRIPDPAHRSAILSTLFLAKPFISYEYRKRLHGEGGLSLAMALGHVRNVATGPFETAAFLLGWIRRRTLAARKFPSIIVRSPANLFSIDFHAEQRPNRDSRITLGATADALGMPRIRVDWRHGSEDIAGVSRGIAALAADLAESGCGVLEYDVAALPETILRDGPYGGHHIGTARMATSPRQGVVDADARVHGMHNLYIASSAVFPTSSQANPTLTIVAMALRLADHLRAPAPVPTAATASAVAGNAVVAPPGGR